MTLNTVYALLIRICVNIMVYVKGLGLGLRVRIGTSVWVKVNVF